MSMREGVGWGVGWGGGELDLALLPDIAGLVELERILCSSYGAHVEGAVLLLYIPIQFVFKVVRWGGGKQEQP